LAAVRIGIAGYMGSGKTTAARYLAAGGALVDADTLAKQVMNGDRALQGRLVSAFGGQIVRDGLVQSGELGRIVFNNLAALKTLNAIVHPALVNELDKCVKAVRGGVCVVDAALIPLWNIQDWFSALLWISSSAALRLKRLETTLSLSRSEISTRMQLQEQLFIPPAEKKWQIIINEDTKARLYAALDRVKAALTSAHH
jgi:dephospho-CoA kinase